MLSRLLLTVALSASISLAQGLPPADNGAPIVVVTEDLANGYVGVQVQNASKIPVTAFVLEGQRTGIPPRKGRDTSVRFYDSVLDSHRSPLFKGGKYVVRMFGPNPPPSDFQRSVSLRAALFEDGTSWGDRSWVSRLIARRQIVHRELLNCVQFLTDPGNEHITRHELADKVEDLRAAKLASATSNEERPLVSAVYKELATHLRQGGSADSLMGDEIKLLRSRVSSIEASRTSFVAPAPPTN